MKAMLEKTKTCTGLRGDATEKETMQIKILNYGLELLKNAN